MLSYCKKCGRIQHDIFEIKLICDVCGSKACEVPKEYIDNFRWHDGDGKQALIEELVKTSPKFDQYLFEHREEILAKQSAEFNAKMEHGSAVLQGKDKGNSYGVTCPNCKATNVRKITVTNKAIHTSVFGIWSIGRNAKNYHCDHCGSEF